MLEIRRTREFADWLRALRDQRAKARIAARIDRLEQDNFGDAKSVGGGVTELRLDYGPGYRVYLCRRGKEIVLLLCGGDKSRQNQDIRKAKALAATFKDIDHGRDGAL